MDDLAVLLFGPQALSFEERDFQRFRDLLVHSTTYRWLYDALLELPTHWNSLVDTIPSLGVILGAQQLQNLTGWLQTGQLKEFPTQLSNLLLSPLVVAVQIAQYSQYRDQTDSWPNIHAESFGFCTGFLSALAVSAGRTVADFQKYGAVAVRLAMLVGAVVDAQDALSEHGPSHSIATSWTSSEAGDNLTRLIKQSPEAYVSVRYDEKRSTVTVSARTQASLVQQLRAADIKTTEVALRGRFHSEVYLEDLASLLQFCDSHVAFQFPDATELAFSTRSNSTGEPILEGKIHHIALRTILVEQCQWFDAFTELYASQLQHTETQVVSFGPEKCIPASFLRDVSSRVVYPPAAVEATDSINSRATSYRDSDIAVVGMSIKVAGADDLEEFWQILSKGESQHQEVPKERFGFDTVFRETDTKRKWFGNFVRDHDTFDHKFFKKSPREIASTDPQQRHMLQAAYQAVEQSGYFRNENATGDGTGKHVGVYIGLCAADYENNIACHPPNAFSATGNLKSFNAGKISHYFGWTGPSLTIDTACSSSAVCVHQACKAILTGECDAALAGGTNIMTHPIWFQNLAGASFLSPTGQCKPFDAKADGYCRGEGIGAVFLKKMSKAIADGDQILGTIAATAVYQNQNCTPIFVPNALSLSDLFRRVTKDADLDPMQVTVVEAHGTGTAVGDPAEYDSIRSVFGGPARKKPLQFGSVKGLIGHTEGTSGVVSLIKILLMLNEGALPPQASYQTLSPGIHTQSDDNMEIVTKLKPWEEEYRAAMINNYGACGSNASLVVAEAPRLGGAVANPSPAQTRLPFWFAALDDRGLKAYITRFSQSLSSKTLSSDRLTLANLSFNVYRQSNRNLPRSLLLTAASIEELQKNLSLFMQGNAQVPSIARAKSTPPVILCFGGQISTFVGLDRQIYDTVHLLRRHLDECDAISKALGVGSIYPGIFQRSPIGDQVVLQTMLFALQYASARSWIACGVQPAALVGHSFGELTALCISGVLSLQDALKLVTKRALLIRESWGPEPGAMMAVEGDLSVIEQLLVEAHQSNPEEPAATIACYNASRSFTLAGSSKAIDAVQNTVAESAAFAGMRSKRLNVTNAFHSTLVHPLIPSLESIADGLTFNEPTIPVEVATEFAAASDTYQRRFPAEHLRQPVYFHHAVQRLSQQYPSAVWLEAGSNSTITTMANRSLGGQSASSSAHFSAVNITGEDTLSSLSDTTVKLWRAGLDVTFWAHEKKQTYSYAPILLPPYQFDKSRHWIDLKAPPRATVVEVVAAAAPVEEELPTELLTFTGYQDAEQRHARFRVNTMIDKYTNLVSGHTVANTSPIMPGTLQVDLAIEAIRGLRPDLAAAKFEPQLCGLENQAPVCVDSSRQVWLDVEADASGHLWAWKIVSNGAGGPGASNINTHVSGKILFRSIDDKQFHLEFSRFERLINHDRCKQLLNNDAAADIIQGRNIYQAFAPVVDYGEIYRGVQKLVGKGTESAGRVAKPYKGETWLDTPVSDCFCQVAGIFVNCMTDHEPTDMFIATGAELWIRSPKLHEGVARPEIWDVYATHRSLDKAWVSDVFIFDPRNGALLEVIMGINYQKIPRLSMSRLLARLTPGVNSKTAATTAPAASVAVPIDAPKTTVSAVKTVKKVKKMVKRVKKASTGASHGNITLAIREVLADLVGLELDEIPENAELADIGVDSLLGMEMAREIELKFKCTLDMDRLVDVTDIPSLLAVVNLALGDAATGGSAVEEYEEVEVEVEVEVEEEVEVPQEDIEVKHDNVEVKQVAVAPSAPRANVTAYLADLLGIAEGDVEPPMLLLDLGIDSLLSTEVRHDVLEKFGKEISEHVAIEELTVEALDTLINGATPVAVAETPTPTLKTNGVHAIHTNGVASGVLELSHETVMTAFGEAKKKTDDFIAEYRCADYMEQVLPKQTAFCIALVVEAFEKLGCFIKKATPGQILPRIPHTPKLARLADYLYRMLEKEARLIDIDGATITRTAVTVPSKSAADQLKDLLRDFPDHTWANKLTYLTGCKMAECLTGEQDGIKLIFGTPEGRELVTGLYGQSLLNLLSVRQMEDFLSTLIAKLPADSAGPLKILEMGAGTGGFTAGILPMLASRSIPIEYTFTDLAPSMVATARKRFKEYPFITFRALDVEKEPPADLVRSQHIVVAHNCIHATHSLTRSGTNTHKILRPDGFLLMLEMTNPVYWVDMIFGVFEGWWLFDDGREHAIAHQSVWQQALQSVGFGHVDWTDGHRPEVEIQRVIIAMASGAKQALLPLPSAPVVVPSVEIDTTETRQRAADGYIDRFVSGFNVPAVSAELAPAPKHDEQVILVTGATGSLGAHLVAHLAGQPNVKTVVCLNRRGTGSGSGTEPAQRQTLSFEQKSIALAASAVQKLQVLETDTSKPQLGLPTETYTALLQTVTQIVHNAWPMSGKRPVRGFEAQFTVMRNLIDFARDISTHRTIAAHAPVRFQFISSISVVGHYPLWSRQQTVPEQRVTMKSVLNNGYSEAKYVCERMLDETLHRHPHLFQPMAVRLGQVAGSSTTGYWNPIEHFPFLIKSSQTLKSLPELRGELSWTPVNEVAATLSDLLLASREASFPVYQIDNPIRQPWEEMLPVLADALGIPRDNVVPFGEWVRRVRHFPGSVELDNPAAKLIEFLDDNFLRMSCGGLLLDTANSREHSVAMRGVGPVSAEVARKYIDAWKKMGFLH
ncbi:hypothetical protein BJX70DRAFT_406246 [Aspergillus crustosus]